MKIINKLERYREDYKIVKGKPFSFFFCPVLFVDEETELCKAHIINKAFRDSFKALTIQRKDVDSFYGSNFESDFVLIQYKTNKMSPSSVIANSKLLKKIDPKIMIGNKSIDFFISKGNVPSQFTQIDVSHQNNFTKIVLKLHPDKMLQLKEGIFHIEIAKDLRIASIVSLIKSAYLTLFELLGYRYALSNSGYFVGKKILGDFFIQNRHKQDKKLIVENAKSFFSDYVNIVRPIIKFNMMGTIEDGKLLLCKNIQGIIWAFIVFIRTDQQFHAVMLPNLDSDIAAAIFIGFLKNKTEKIDVCFCQFDSHNNCWNGNDKTFQISWPKSNMNLFE
jgi:hypothetical protein